MRIFEQHNALEQNAKPILHHANSQSFISSVTTGCSICRAILSELDEPQKLLLNPNIISFTECTLEDISSNRDDRKRFYYLHFTWKAEGYPGSRRSLLVQPYGDMQKYLPNRPIEAHRGWGNQTNQMVKTWMDYCLEEHPKCRALHAWRTSGLGFQPKRLVDIGAMSETMWRLVIREDSTISPVTYAALSHRWGTDQQFKLINENVQAYIKGRPLEILPPVFQDAIQVIRSLGIRYLWVDCLCIIQDSLPDWETESLEMHKIYANSICNISLTGFEDNATGFLDKTCDYVPLPCRVQPRWAPTVDEGWCVLDPFFWWAQVTKAPLARRGWVFQERFLAPRVIHFGPEQLLWECASLDACEAYPQGLPRIVKSPSHTGFKRLDFLFESDMRENLHLENGRALVMTEEDLLYFWCEVVLAYTRTSITNPGDKLIALAGVAQLISPMNDSTYATSPKRYLAGLFNQHLLLMLEWHTQSIASLPSATAGVRAPQYRAPSWSWASVDGRVYYDYLPRSLNESKKWNLEPSWAMFIEQLNLHNPRLAAHCPIPSECLGWKPLVFELKASITTAGESPFGQILHGHVELTGRLISARDIITSSFNDLFSRPMLSYFDSPTISDGAIEIKSNTVLLPLRCSQLRRLEDETSFYWATGLLLEPLNVDESVYQRCGMLCILSTEGVRDIGVEITDTPFAAKYSKDAKLETIRII